MSSVIFYRFQMDIERQQDGSYARRVAQLCWRRIAVDENGQPIPEPPESGIVDLELDNYPELKQVIEQATFLAVPLAVAKMNALTQIPAVEEAIPPEQPVSEPHQPPIQESEPIITP